jgi:exopolysaccharide biosynthesis WecB/TagA/CpsF family protein
MQKTPHKSKHNSIILRTTFILDELSILLSFFLALSLRYDAIQRWKDYNEGIYTTMIVTVLLFCVIVFLVYDYRRPDIVVMDPVDNLLRLCKSRFLLALMTIVYFYVTQKSVLASRIVMALFLALSVAFGYIIRMVYRSYYIKKYGVPGDIKAYQLHLSSDGVKNQTDIRNAINRIKSGEYDCALVIPNQESDNATKEVLKELETAGVRSYLALNSMDYNVRSGIISDIDSYATIPAYVRNERTNIFGVNYCISRTEEAVHHVLSHLDDLKGQYICFSNVHTTVMAKENPDYAQILNEAAMVFPDGAPIAKLEAKRGFEGAERVAGPDFMNNMFRDTADGKVSHYFYGSTDETLKKLQENLKQKYPNINIKGIYSPPFRQLSDEEDEEDIKRINDSGADIVWIGLGAPKQEKWMNAHKGKLNAVMMGVGAGFDFHAGTIQRAPIWLQKIGLEWLYRLLKDPVRLYKRYIVTNTKFLWYILKG